MLIPGENQRMAAFIVFTKKCWHGLLKTFAHFFNCPRGLPEEVILANHNDCIWKKWGSKFGIRFPHITYKKNYTVMFFFRDFSKVGNQMSLWSGWKNSQYGALNGINQDALIFLTASISFEFVYYQNFWQSWILLVVLLQARQMCSVGLVSSKILTKWSAWMIFFTITSFKLSNLLIQ